MNKEFYLKVFEIYANVKVDKGTQKALINKCNKDKLLLNLLKNHLESKKRKIDIKKEILQYCTTKLDNNSNLQYLEICCNLNESRITDLMKTQYNPFGISTTEIIVISEAINYYKYLLEKSILMEVK